MLDKEEVKASEEVVENIEKEKEEEKVREVNDEKVSEDETDKINEFVEEEALKNKEDEVHNDLKNEGGFLQDFKEGIKNTLGIFVVSVGGLVVLGLILRYILGFNIKDVWGMLFIVYLVVSLFYPYIKSKLYKKNK